MKEYEGQKVFFTGRNGNLFSGVVQRIDEPTQQCWVKTDGGESAWVKRRDIVLV